MPYQPVSIEFADTETGTWVDLDLGRLNPGDVQSWPFEGMANRFKSSSPECEIFIHQPLAMLLDTRNTTSNVDERELLNRVLDGVDTDTPVSTSIVNHEETLGGYHLLALVSRGHGSGPTLAITMWKFAPPTQTEGAVVVAARAALSNPGEASLR